jgi:hypothetical protein
MPGIERSQGFEFRIDQLSKKIQELRGDQQSSGGLDEGLDVVEQNTGRQAASEAVMNMRALTGELSLHGESLHGLDAARVAELISDPFGDD